MKKEGFSLKSAVGVEKPANAEVGKSFDLLVGAS